MASALSTAVILSVRHLGHGPLATLDPFLFFVYHKDAYPAGGPRMEVVGRRGNGADFNPAAPFRFYHGDDVPGFPQHPHRGFETLTATIDGIIDHADSVKNHGRYGKGDLQWMTAGEGVCHSEMFPLVEADAPNPTRFFQIWLNLPRKSKMAKPAFVMHWAEEIPRWRSEDGKACATVWAGSLFGRKALQPTPQSWAADPANDVGVFHVQLEEGGSIELPPCEGGAATNRVLYVIEGRSAEVAGRAVTREDVVAYVQVRGDAAVPVRAHDGPTEVLILQAKPIGEPVVQHGPFVMNSREEIAEAFSDYRRTQFGGWPWPRDDMIFPRHEGRFAVVDGKRITPGGEGVGKEKDEL